MQADATVKDLEKAVKEMREQEAYTSYDISRLTDALARKDAEQRDAKEEMAASIDILQKRVHTLTKVPLTSLALHLRNPRHIISGLDCNAELETYLCASAHQELSNNSATLSHRMEELQNSRQQVSGHDLHESAHDYLPIRVACLHGGSRLTALV
jgi:predicted  nucleic acid-binding Zn-ribbon protein